MASKPSPTEKTAGKASKSVITKRHSPLGMGVFRHIDGLEFSQLLFLLTIFGGLPVRAFRTFSLFSRGGMHDFLP
jgi:hypothetical protein